LNQGRERDKSVNNLNDKLNNLDERLHDYSSDSKPPQDDKNLDGRLGIDYWRGKWIVPVDIWRQGINVYGALKCFPDRYMPEILELERFTMYFRLHDVFDSRDSMLKDAFELWKSDYLALLEYRRDSEYGHTKCYNCLLSQRWDNGLFMGIYRILANSLGIEADPLKSIYPCNVVNRFKCPYDRTIEREYTVTKDNIAKVNSTEVDYLFHLGKIAEAVEEALIKAQELGNDSVIIINSPQDVYEILRDREKLEKILDQGLREDEKLCYLDEYLKERRKWKEEDEEKYKSTILDFFSSIRGKININDLMVFPRQAVYPS
jgi:hypothetical protein